jgi:hypothetical protein
MQPGRLAVLGGLGETERRDSWLLGPVITALVLVSFVVYGTFRAIWAIWYDTYHLGPDTGRFEDHAYLLSPFFSPLITGPWMPAWMSPAFLILWAPGGFRVTCYYYRKAYYRSLFLDPVACAVGEPGSFCGVPRGRAYKGETKLLLFQNLHRYFLYLALGFLVILFIDVILACRWPDGFGVSVGTLVLFANWALLSSYTLSCHSLRHLIGGRLDRFSGSVGARAGHAMWTCASALNKHHMSWAWLSLFGVALADLYVWMAAAGVIRDVRLF